jgi:hypothetical protein
MQKPGGAADAVRVPEPVPEQPPLTTGYVLPRWSPVEVTALLPAAGRRWAWVLCSLAAAAVWGLVALSAALNLVSFEPTANARYTAGVYGPRAGGLGLAAGVATIAALLQLGRRTATRKRAAILAAMTLLAAVIAGDGIRLSSDRRHLGPAIAAVAARLQVRGAIATGPATEDSTPEIHGTTTLSAPSWVQRWVMPTSKLTDDCPDLVFTPAIAWHRGSPGCTYLSHRYPIMVVVATDSSAGETVVTVQTRPAYP